MDDRMDRTLIHVDGHLPCVVRRADDGGADKSLGEGFPPAAGEVCTYVGLEVCVCRDGRVA